MFKKELHNRFSTTDIPVRKELLKVPSEFWHPFSECPEEVSHNHRNYNECYIYMCPTSQFLRGNWMCATNYSLAGTFHKEDEAQEIHCMEDGEETPKPLRGMQ